MAILDRAKERQMSNQNRLRELLIDFFGLPPQTTNEELAQTHISAWDSLAMVQIIGELQSTFEIEFELEEIESLRSYEEIANCLRRKGVTGYE